MASIPDSQNLAAVVRDVQTLGETGSGSSTDRLDARVTMARSIIQYLDQSSLLQRVASLDDHLLIVSRLQVLAYDRPEIGCARDIADWCVRQWLLLLQQHSSNVDILQGWPLLQIHRRRSNN
jgi:hypothetical protein